MASAGEGTVAVLEQILAERIQKMQTCYTADVTTGNSASQDRQQRVEAAFEGNWRSLPEAPGLDRVMVALESDLRPHLVSGRIDGKAREMPQDPRTHL